MPHKPKRTQQPKRPNPETPFNNPNDPGNRWPALLDWILHVTQVVTGDGMSEPALPFGRTVPPEMERACDQWFQHLIKQGSCGPKDLPPPMIAPWLWMRLMVVGEYVWDKIHSKAPAHTYKHVPEAFEDLLLKRWKSELHEWWRDFNYDGTKVSFRGRMVLYRPDDRLAMAHEEEDEDAVTWAKLHDLLEMLGAGLAQRVKGKLPFGKMPTPEMDKRCDKWFQDFIDGADAEKAVKTCPVEVAQWCAARCFTAAGRAFANMNYNQNPPDYDFLWEAMEDLVITQWNGTLKRMWPGFYDQGDGKIGFRGDSTVDFMQSKGQFFTGN